MKIITYIYSDFNHWRKDGTNKERYDAKPDQVQPEGHHLVSSSFKFRQSCAHFGYDVLNVSESSNKIAFAQLLPMLYRAFKALPPDEVAMYADGADTFFLRPINPPTDKILYMAEKNIWPEVPELIEAYKAHYVASPWAYVNGGAYVGPAGLISEFMDRYGLNNPGPIGDAHSQRLQSMAYLQAVKDGFPIELDQECRELQTIGFTNEGDFEIDGDLIYNNITGTYPALFHGNGRTAMNWVYPLLKHNGTRTTRDTPLVDAGA